MVRRIGAKQIKGNKRGHVKRKKKNQQFFLGWGAFALFLGLAWALGGE